MRHLFIILSLIGVMAGAEKAEAGWLVIQNNVYTQDIAVVSVSPAANQQVTAPPKSVTITFTAAVNPEQSSIDIYDPYNNKLTTGPLSVNGRAMSVNMPQLTQGYSGTYRVVWHAVCECTSPSPVSGNYYFSIL